jgi:hypothetical protein
MSRIENFKKIQNEGLELFIKKNTDYGDAFALYGVVGVLIRMQDKLARYISINKTSINLVDNESIRDTLIDLMNYSGMALLLLDEK